jgi:hypothetical protein
MRVRRQTVASDCGSRNLAELRVVQSGLPAARSAVFYRKQADLLRWRMTSLHLGRRILCLCKTKRSQNLWRQLLSFLNLVRLAGRITH